LIRLGTRTSTLGTASYPGPLDPPVSVRGSITVPGERHYQVWYRNAAAFCTSATFNLTNALRGLWVPQEAVRESRLQPLRHAWRRFAA
jgi:hypothetical protein